MLFNSFAFLLFLPTVFAVYWLIAPPKGGAAVSSVRLQLQNLFVVAASYVFYGWWDWKFLLLISFISLWAWVSGLAMERFPKKGKLTVALALVVNLGILGVFKYFNFFIDNAVVLLNALGFAAHPLSLKIILPVGLSFYTFQSLGYVFDVRRGTVRACRNPISFFAYMSFFPQILAGPIERASEQLPQFERTRRFDYALAVDGCRQMLWGFFKKFAVADACAIFVDGAFGQTAGAGCVTVAVATFLFTVQIYCDFSGYSDLAVGCGKLFGFRLVRNFAFPYFASSVADFWRRWHISLMTWFRDYLYIPLGGSRVGRLKRIRNTFVVFLVSGLWHGANWTFVLWGALHAVAFLPRLLGNPLRTGETPSRVRSFCGWFLTMAVVMFGWLVFRAPDLHTLADCLVSIANWDGAAAIKGMGFTTVLPLVVVVFVVEWLGRRGEHALSRLALPRMVRWGFYLAVVALTLYGMPSKGGDFIYGQF